jgi:hypothetical protein
VEGFNTVALQEQEPELFDVIEKNGVQHWNLRLQVREALYNLRAQVACVHWHRAIGNRKCLPSKALNEVIPFLWLFYIGM